MDCKCENFPSPWHFDSDCSEICLVKDCDCENFPSPESEKNIIAGFQTPDKRKSFDSDCSELCSDPEDELAKVLCDCDNYPSPGSEKNSIAGFQKPNKKKTT